MKAFPLAKRVVPEYITFEILYLWGQIFGPLAIYWRPDRKVEHSVESQVSKSEYYMTRVGQRRILSLAAELQSVFI